jgi:hypothetical protein
MKSLLLSNDFTTIKAASATTKIYENATSEEISNK